MIKIRLPGGSDEVGSDYEIDRDYCGNDSQDQ